MIDSYIFLVFICIIIVILIIVTLGDWMRKHLSFLIVAFSTILFIFDLVWGIFTLNTNSSWFFIASWLSSFIIPYSGIYFTAFLRDK